MKPLIKRSISAILFTVIMIAAFLWKQTAFCMILYLIVLMTEEYFKMTVRGRRYWKEKLCIYVTEIAFFCLSFLAIDGILDPVFITSAFLPLLAAAIFMLFDCAEDVDFNANLFFPLIYITLPLASTSLLLFPSGTFDGIWLLCVFAAVWMNDVGAYIFGMSFGQRPESRKLAPSLSPKKSWAGFWGGVLFTLLTGIAIYLLAGSRIVPLTHTIILSIIIALSGVCGDLFESLIKRHADVKDAGRVMPGHGGALDRFDGALFAIPAVVIYLELFELI